MFRFIKKFIYPEQTKSLTEIPEEIYHNHIFHHLDQTSALALSETCRYLHTAASNNPAFKQSNVRMGPDIKISNMPQFFFKEHCLKKKAAMFASIFKEGMPGYVPGYFLGFGGAEPNFNYDREPIYYMRESIFTEEYVYPYAIVKYAIDHLGVNHTSFFESDDSENTMLHFMSAGTFHIPLNAYLTEFGKVIDINMQNKKGQTAFSLAFDELYNDIANEYSINPFECASFQTVMVLLRHGAKTNDITALPYKSYISYHNEDFEPSEDDTEFTSWIEEQKKQNQAWRDMYKLMLENGMDIDIFIKNFAKEYEINREFYNNNKITFK